MAFGTWYSNVIDKRKEALKAYVKSIILDKEIMLLSLNGDASFRRYFRVADTSYIAVDAPPQTQKNQEFIQIDEALVSSKVKVPKIIAYDLDQGFMLLEDLGDTTFAKVAIGDRQEYFYQKAIEVLGKIATVSLPSLPKFDEAFIKFELSLFDTWMLDKALKVTLTDSERNDLNEAYDYLTANCLMQEQIAMHRDYHSRNLMVCQNDELAVIDFQDMVKGPLCYDLASIVYDCYVVLDKALVNNLTIRAYDLYQSKGFLKDLSYEKFLNQLRLTSLQRHVKVLGIFCRLSIRDGKDGYLKDLPRVINYVLTECGDDPKLLKLKQIIEKYVVGKF